MIKRFWFILLIVALLSSSSFFLFANVTEFSDKVNLTACFLVFFTQTAALMMFLASLKAFKKDLRVAYRALAAGILLFSLIPMPLPIINIFPNVDPIKLSWAIAGCALLGSMVIYAAIHKFARLLEVRNTYTSYWLAGGAAIVIGVLTSFLPHTELPISEIAIDSIFGAFAAAGAFMAIAAALVLRVRHELSQTYKTAMNWLAIALFMAAFGCFHEVITKILEFFNQEQFDNYYYYGISLWPFLLSGLLFLKASLAFRATSVAVNELPENTSTLDIITYVAGLAANPAAIDTTLDKVRQITALHKTSSKLSAADESALRGVYLDIERYLTTKEPLRFFSKEDLRSRLPERFQRSLTSKSA